MRLLAVALVVLALAATAPARSGGVEPVGPPPQLVGAGATPPPAWIEVRRGAKWLAYSTYCMRGAVVPNGWCIEAARQPCDSLPQIVARPGEVLHIHLGFEPWVRPWRVDGLGRKTVHAAPPGLSRADARRLSYAFCVVRRPVAVARTDTTPLWGRVVASPGFPGCSDQAPCRPPMAGWLVAFALDGVRVASARTDSDGWYVVSLPPGVYTTSVPEIKPSGAGRGFEPYAILVPAAPAAMLDFRYDGGIQ